MEKIVINNKEYKPFTSLEEFKLQCEKFEMFLDNYSLDPVVEDIYDLVCNEDNDAIVSICEAMIEQFICYSADGDIIANNMPDGVKRQLNKFRKQMIENQIENQ